MCIGSRTSYEICLYRKEKTISTEVPLFYFSQFPHTGNQHKGDGNTKLKKFLLNFKLCKYNPTEQNKPFPSVEKNYKYPSFIYHHLERKKRSPSLSRVKSPLFSVDKNS